MIKTCYEMLKFAEHEKSCPYSNYNSPIISKIVLGSADTPIYCLLFTDDLKMHIC